jgi:hypothetical protein
LRAVHTDMLLLHDFVGSRSFSNDAFNNST